MSNTLLEIEYEYVISSNYKHLPHIQELNIFLPGLDSMQRGVTIPWQRRES